MNFTSSHQNAHESNADCLIVAVCQKTLEGTAAELDSRLKGRLSAAIDSKDVATRVGETSLMLTPELETPRLLLVGCGKSMTVSPADYRKLHVNAMKQLRKMPITSASSALGEVTVDGADTAWTHQQAVLAFDHASYQYSATKKIKKPASIRAITLHDGADEPMLRKAQSVAAGVRRARELGNLPPNICTPEYLGGIAAEIADLHDAASLELLDQDQMKALGMGALLGVAQGSANLPRLIVLKYLPNADQKPVVLVGKGITFDTGGISLKAGKGMHEMKYDMGGAAAMLGTFEACVRQSLNHNVIAIVPAVENMPDGKAYRPGDVLTSMSGTTIEVLNTDAEGRLILCDALSYAERFEPEILIDAATLTGACVVALGKHATGLMTDDDELANALLAAGESTLDRAWRLPLWDAYQTQLDTPYADVANVGGADAGCITAGCFLKRFTKGQRWAHLDIAGTAWDGGTKNGATGRPVALLSEYLSLKAATA